MHYEHLQTAPVPSAGAPTAPSSGVKLPDSVKQNVANAKAQFSVKLIYGLNSN